MRLTWKKHKREAGLAGIGRGAPKGSDLNSGGVEYASVYYSEGNLRYKVGWYWCAGENGSIPRINTAHSPVATEAEAKAAAKAYILEHLNKGTK